MLSTDINGEDDDADNMSFERGGLRGQVLFALLPPSTMPSPFGENPRSNRVGDLSQDIAQYFFLRHFCVGLAERNGVGHCTSVRACYLPYMHALKLCISQQSSAQQGCRSAYVCFLQRTCLEVVPTLSMSRLLFFRADDARFPS